MDERRGNQGGSPGDGLKQRRRDWRLEAIGWDGGLPLIVAITPEVLPLFLDPFVAKCYSVGVVPLFACLFRAHRGERQIRAIHPSMPIWRQGMLALAIVLLLVFEIMLTTLQCERIADLNAWLTAGGMYVVYLAMIAITLRPKRLPRPKVEPKSKHAEVERWWE